MEENQYKLCTEILKRLDAAGVLSKIVLIGSWCVPLYKKYFENKEEQSLLDVFRPLPKKWQKMILKSLEEEKETVILELLKA